VNRSWAKAANESDCCAEALDRFRQLVLGDPGLLNVFRNTSETAAFIELVVALGRERGYMFTAQEVENELRRSRRLWIERPL
jgi:hypothetical protein